MNHQDEKMDQDEELHRLLARWAAPVVPEDMDDRVLAAFRRRAGLQSGGWSRLFTGSVRVPIPVALGVMVLLLVTVALAFRPVPAPATTVAPEPETVKAARQAETPVVTHTSLAGFRPVSEVTATVLKARKESRP